MGGVFHQYSFLHLKRLSSSLPASVLNYLRLSQRFYLKKTTGAEESMRVGFACVHRSANKEKAVLKGKACKMPEVGITLNHQNFPQYVGKLIVGKIN